MTSRDKSVASRECLTLAERVEAADGPDRELLVEAHSLCFPWSGGGNLSKAYADHWSRHDRFMALLDLEAFLDAAMTLVPEGWNVGIFLRHDWSKQNAQVWHLEIEASTKHGDAATPALALCAAALRARAGVTQ